MTPHPAATPPTAEQVEKCPPLGSHVQVNSSSRYYSDWQGATLVVTGLNLSPAGVVSVTTAESDGLTQYGRWNNPTDGWAISELDVLAALAPAERASLSRDGTMSVKDVIDGVKDLFPSADRQALQCLAELLLKAPAERAEAVPASVSVDALVSAMARDRTLGLASRQIYYERAKAIISYLPAPTRVGALDAAGAKELWTATVVWFRTINGPIGPHVVASRKLQDLVRAALAAGDGGAN
jgi:hypothetical protein